MSRWIPLLPILAGLLVLKAYGLHLVPGDEGIYFYLAQRVGRDGLVPYRDFFFAHPPVHLLAGSLAFALFGATPLVAKLVPALASVGTVAVVYAASLRRLGRFGAVVAAVGLAVTYDYLRASSHFTGVNVTLLLATFGAWMAMSRRPLASGIASALAVLTGLYALPTALGCGLVCLLAGRGAAARFALAFAAVLALVVGGFYLVAGGAFFDQVVGYHLAKPGARWAGVAMAGRVFTDSLFLTVGSLLGVVALGAAVVRGAWRPRSWHHLRGVLLDEHPHGVGVLAILLAAGNVVALSSLQRAFPFYFLMALPGCAVATGYAAWWLYGGYVHLVNPPVPRLRWRGALLVGGAVLTFVLAAPAQRAARARWYAGSVAERVHGYDWAAAPVLPAALDGGVRKLLWTGRREAHTEYSGVQRYLWHESRRTPLLEEIAAWVRAHTPADGTLFGDSVTAPYVAFLAGRRIAADEADSNAVRFRSGATAPADVIARVEADPGLTWILARPGAGFTRIGAFQPWLRRMERSQTWRDPRRGQLVLLRPRR